MNFKTFKEMSFKKKLQWLVQYYGIVALVVIIGILVAFNFIKSVLSPAPMADVCVMILSDDIYTEDAIEMQFEMTNKFDCQIEVNAYMPSDPYGMQSFATRVMTDQIDIVIAPKNEMEDMLNNSYITEYETVNNSDMCMAVPVKARKGAFHDKALEYIRDWFSEN